MYHVQIISMAVQPVDDFIDFSFMLKYRTLLSAVHVPEPSALPVMPGASQTKLPGLSGHEFTDRPGFTSMKDSTCK